MGNRKDHIRVRKQRQRKTKSDTNKTFLTNDLISSHGLDFLFMTEMGLMRVIRGASHFLFVRPRFLSSLPFLVS